MTQHPLFPSGELDLTGRTAPAHMKAQVEKQFRRFVYLVDRLRRLVQEYFRSSRSSSRASCTFIIMTCLTGLTAQPKADEMVVINLCFNTICSDLTLIQIFSIKRAQEDAPVSHRGDEVGTVN